MSIYKNQNNSITEVDMKIKFNLISFILSLICIMLFIVSLSSADIIETSYNLITMHPLHVVLIISIVTCILGFIGFAECVNWKLLIRSFFTIGVTTSISVFIIFILVISYLVG